MLLICAAPDPAALEGDTKATIQAIRMFTHHAISVFFVRFRTLVGNTNSAADRLEMNRAWRYMDWLIHYYRRQGYQDDEFLPDLVDGLASLITKDQTGIDRQLDPRLRDHEEWFKDEKRKLNERRMV